VGGAGEGEAVLNLLSRALAKACADADETLAVGVRLLS
jgi:hypothetical protein